MSQLILPDLGRVDRVYVDTETTGLGYRDKAVGLSLKVPGQASLYAAWGHPEGNNVSRQDVAAWSQAELTRPGLTVVYLNGPFDIRMLRKAGLKVTDQAEDVGAQAALLNEYEPDYALEGLAQRHCGLEKDDQALNDWCAQRFGGRPTRKAQAENYHKAPGWLVGPYACGDTDLTAALDQHFQPQIVKAGLAPVYELECQLIPVLVRMYQAGVKVDVARAQQVRDLLAQEQLQRLAEWEQLAGHRNFTGKNQLVDLFVHKLGLDIPKTEKGNYSLNKEVLAGLDHPVAGLLRRLRQLEHYIGTFIDSYIFDNLEAGDLIHPNFHSTKSERGGTITGRLSSAGGLNAQNIPSRDDVLAPLIRSIFIPKNKYSVWLKEDYSQIEYRFFAHYAGGKLRAEYQANPDIDFHDMVAKMTGMPRKAAKNVNFAKLYGAGPAKIAMMVGCTLEEAQEFVRTYEARIPEARELSNTAMSLAAQRRFVITWGGRILRFRYGFDPKKNRMAVLGTFKAMNKVLQGSSADLTKKAMVRVDKLIDWETTVMHLTVHDELDFSTPEGKEGLAKAWEIKQAMEDYQLTVPIRAGADIGPNWGAVEEVDWAKVRAA